MSRAFNVMEGSEMNAIILYDSQRGNTETIAEAIESGMRQAGFDDVYSQRGGETTHNELREADIWIFGCPTYKGKTSGKFRRLLRWMKKEKAPDKMGFAFETRLDDSEGGAAAVIEAVMRKCGVEIIHDTESFAVEDWTGHLASGEEDRAFALGRTIAEEIADLS